MTSSDKYRRNHQLTNGLLVSVVGICSLLNSIRRGLPKNFVGDDALLLQASRFTGSYAASVLTGFNDVGAGKWRPAFSTLVSPFINWFGDNYLAYAILNSALSICIGLTVLTIIYCFKSDAHLVALSASVLAVLSQFTWYSSWSPYGLMELGAALATLGGTAFAIRALKSWTSKSNWSAAICILISASFHERYLAAVIPIVVILCLSRPRTLLKVLTPWVVLFGSYVIFKIGVLRLSLFTGGGEVPLSESKGTWILGRIITAFQAILGLGSGVNINFNVPDLRRSAPPPGIFQFFFLVTTLLLGCIALGLLQEFSRSSALRRKVRREWVREDALVPAMLASICIALVVPACTVISRIEGRWLYGPQIFLVLLLACLHALMQARLQKRMALFAMFMLLIGAITSNYFRPSFEYQMRHADRLIETVRTHPIPDSMWTLSIRDDKFGSDQWPWMLAYGFVFLRNVNPPTRIQVGFSDCAGPCLTVDTRPRIWRVRLIPSP